MSRKIGGLVCTLIGFLEYTSHLPFTEEILIDFKELIGEHSGENMALAVWDTMEEYGLKGRVCPVFNSVFLGSDGAYRSWASSWTMPATMTL
jgi:hypothetical protein